MRPPFYIYPRRKSPIGGILYVYYNVPRPYGKGWRTDHGHSTGTNEMAKARQWATDHLDQFVPKAKVDPGREGRETSLKTFAKDFFDPSKPYLLSKSLFGTSPSPATRENKVGLLKNRIIPYWGHWMLADISISAIKKWLFGHVAQGRSHNYIKASLGLLREILSAALDEGLILSNPAREVPRISDDHQKTGILTADEVRRLLDPDGIDYVWDGDRPQYTLNLLASRTGMRVSEITGLQRQNVRAEGDKEHPYPHIEIVTAWKGKYGLGAPKSRWATRGGAYSNECRRSTK